MKNKLMMILAFAIGASTVMPVIASADTFYQDALAIINDPISGKNDKDRLENVDQILSSICRDKKHMADRILWQHTNENSGVMFGTGVSGLGLLSIADAMRLFYQGSSLSWQANDRLAAGVILVTGGLAVMFEKCIKLYQQRKKIAEMNEVITKLEALKAELTQKIEATTQEQA